MEDNGGGKLSVRTEAEDDACGIRVTIEDTGPGIPDDVLPQVFEPFFTTKQDKQGVGLGLSVVYGIIKRHEGDIQIDSKVGHGTTIMLRLPTAPDLTSRDKVGVFGEVMA